MLVDAFDTHFRNRVIEAVLAIEIGPGEALVLTHDTEYFFHGVPSDWNMVFGKERCIGKRCHAEVTATSQIDA